jgi:hypothetical protein
MTPSEAELETEACSLYSTLHRVLPVKVALCSPLGHDLLANTGPPGRTKIGFLGTLSFFSSNFALQAAANCKGVKSWGQMAEYWRLWRATTKTQSSDQQRKR